MSDYNEFKSSLCNIIDKLKELEEVPDPASIKPLRFKLSRLSRDIGMNKGGILIDPAVDEKMQALHVRSEAFIAVVRGIGREFAFLQNPSYAVEFLKKEVKKGYPPWLIKEINKTIRLAR